MTTITEQTSTDRPTATGTPTVEGAVPAPPSAST